MMVQGHQIRHVSHQCLSLSLSLFFSLSPSKARHQLALVIQIFLNFLPHVEDGTIPAAEE